MYHITHIRFIDPHTKGNRGDHNINIIILKITLSLSAFFLG